MFLCTLSVLVCLLVANSSAQHEQLEADGLQVASDRYSVPQVIRDRVPVNFAAMNLRRSRLKNQTDRNTLRHHPDVDKGAKASFNQPKRINIMKNSTKQLKYGKQKGEAHKRPVDDKFVGSKKSSRFRMDNFQGTSPTTSTQRLTIPPKEISIESTNFDKNALSSQSHTTINPNAMTQTSGNSFANIKKAINALPQQMVKVVRDDIDCNDDPMKNRQNTRGPPCTFSLRWPGTGGHPALWLNNVPPNWQLFY